ncbi:MAG: hypothetical protein ACK4MD_12025, partial [Demequina sp.]
GRDIWVADAGLIAQLQTDRSFVGRNDVLSVAAAGSSDPQGYVRSGFVRLSASESVLVRNTGSALEPGGVLVGGADPELSIVFENFGFLSAIPTPIDVFAY